MIAAIAYPFGLFRRRVFSSLLGLSAFVGILCAIDVAFLSAGQDVVNDRQSGASQLDTVLGGLLSLIAGAMVMATALIDLKRRDGDQKPSPADGISQFLINIKFGFTVLLPALVAALGAGALGRINPWATISAEFVIACILIYVSVRLFLAWPMAVSDGEAKLFRAWDVSKNKFWPLFGVLLLVYLIGLAPFVGVVVVAGVLNALAARAEIATSDETWISMVVQNLANGLFIFYTAAAAACLYNAVSPAPANLAEEF